MRFLFFFLSPFVQIYTRFMETKLHAVTVLDAVVECHC